jgi:hypothetical protein
MVDETPEDNEKSGLGSSPDLGPLPDPGRAKRAAPTIDLEASEISSETRPAGADAQPEEPPFQEPPAAPVSSPVSSPVSPWVIAPVSGLVAAALVIGVAWMLGWPAVVAPSAAPKVDTAVVDGLAARIASVETKANKPPDPATAARVEALEKSLAALRGELASVRAQSEKLAAVAGDIKATPGDAVAAPDLSAITERLTQLEQAARTQGAEIAQENNKIADSKPADDLPLRRIVAAALLDVMVRIGDPYPAALAAAKSLSDNAAALKPLEGFAASGVPSAAVLSRELLTLVPKLSPPSPETSATGGGIVDRLQAGAAKLVRIERTDAVGTDRGAVVARITAAALRNDSNEARRELNTLAPENRAAAQGWLDKADARDAALAASRQFAADAMAALAKPAQ